MRQLLKSLLLIGSSACLMACTSMPGTSGKSVTSNAIVTAESEKPKQGLPAQNLAIGECGLFLWTRREEPEFVFFSRAGEDTAEFWLDGQVRKLTRTGIGGDIFGQQLTEQTFVMPDGRTVQLSMVPGELLIGGQRVPEASFMITDSDGWETVMPAAGVSACQTEEANNVARY